MLKIEIQKEFSDELWADVPGFEQALEVSTHGRIRSKRRLLSFSDNKPDRYVGGTILRTPNDRGGYPRLRGSFEGCKVNGRVHRFVALAFIANPEDKPQVNHKDGIKINNHVSNLEWCTNSENQIHAVQNGLLYRPFGSNAYRFTGPVLVFKDGIQIDTLHGNQEMAEKGYDFRLVSACLMGKRKTHRDCTFKKETT